VRVVIVEDNVLLRAGLVELLTAAGFDVAGQAGDAGELLELVNRLSPDVVVLDIRMPPTHTLEGLDAARAIRERHGTDVGILLLSHHVEAQHALDLLAGGAAGVGYLLKDRILDPAELAAAITRVAAGGSAIDPSVIEQLLRRRSADGRLSALTPRERDVLAAMAEGRSNLSIAKALSISDKTVEACTGRIFSKLGLEPGPGDHRRVRAVLAYLDAASGE
jgi:serine/threonine-protein kinase